MFAHSVNIELSAAVTIQRTALGDPARHSGAGSGISAQMSGVQVFDCVVAGGGGGAVGPKGIVAVESFVYLHNTEVTGGQRRVRPVPTLGVDVQRYYVQLFAINPSQFAAFGGSGQALTLLRSGS